MIMQTNFVKFWGIAVDNTLSWKQHIDTIIPKLIKACYIIRSCKLHSFVSVKMKWNANNIVDFDMYMSYRSLFHATA